MTCNHNGALKIDGALFGCGRRKGDTFASTYDALNRRTLFDGPSTALDVAYTYDNLGRMLTATGPHATTLAWDALGRLTKETSPFGDMTYQYDLAGRRTRQTWPDSFYVTQDWNLSNQMTAIKHAGTTQIIGYSYDNLGRRTGITRGNGVSTTYGYDGISRLTSLTHDVGGTAADVAFAYSYNPAGQIVTRVSNNDAYSHAFGSTLTQTSVIDGLNRLATLNTVTVAARSASRFQCCARRGPSCRRARRRRPGRTQTRWR